MYTIISLKMYSFINGEKRRRKGGGFNAFICSNITYQYICTTLSKDSKFTGNMDLILQKTKLTSVQIPINNNNGNSSPTTNYTHLQCPSILQHKYISTLWLHNNGNIHTFAHYHPSPNGKKHFVIITTGNS